MAQTLRVFYRGVQGRQRTNLNWSPISEKSTVIITAAEWHPSGGIFGLSEGRYNLGDANVYVTNIGPHGDQSEAGGVEFYVHADSGAPVDVVAAITVLEDYEEFVDGG
jgi:hypothetical protein